MTNGFVFVAAQEELELDLRPRNVMLLWLTHQSTGFGCLFGVGDKGVRGQWGARGDLLLVQAQNSDSIKGTLPCRPEGSTPSGCSLEGWKRNERSPHTARAMISRALGFE